MAKQLIRFPGHMSRLLLRIIGMAVTSLFTFFVSASGQIISPGKALTKAESVTVVPAYGIALYGMPSASFTIKGTVTIAQAHITLQDTLTKQIVDSSISKADGSFFMTFSEMPRALTTWVLAGIRNPDCEIPDTLISVPLDSLKGGSGFYVGADTVNINPIARCRLLSEDPTTHPSQTLAMRVSQRANGAIETEYMLPTSGQIRMGLYG